MKRRERRRRRKAATMWEAGEAVSDIGEEIGLSDASVYRLISKLGLGRKDRPKKVSAAKPRAKRGHQRHQSEHLTDREIADIGGAFKAGEPGPVICDRFRISSSTLTRLVQRKDWCRPASYDSSHNRRVLDQHQEKRFAEMWVGNATHRAMMREFKASRSWIVRHAQALGLPPREQRIVWESWLKEKMIRVNAERSEQRHREAERKAKEREKVRRWRRHRIGTMVRLHNAHYGTAAIGERFGIKRETVRFHLLHARRSGEFGFVRRAYRYLSNEERECMCELRRLGVTMGTVALMLKLDYRQAISLSAGLPRHRNFCSPLFSVLAPDRLLAAQKDGHKVEEVLQAVYRRLDHARGSQFRRCLNDYNEAGELFPDLLAGENPLPMIKVLGRAPLRRGVGFLMS